mmetsp:Transcript_118948/g.341756  ORF Transcript_118948/g.341756 Transcript_118948/m.341756 type:complete len:226 (-) Transcript_118948:1219-1896(-)
MALNAASMQPRTAGALMTVLRLAVEMAGLVMNLPLLCTSFCPTAVCGPPTWGWPHWTPFYRWLCRFQASDYHCCERKAATKPSVSLASQEFPCTVMMVWAFSRQMNASSLKILKALSSTVFQLVSYAYATWPLSHLCWLGTGPNCPSSSLAVCAHFWRDLAKLGAKLRIVVSTMNLCMDGPCCDFYMRIGRWTSAWLCAASSCHRIEGMQVSWCEFGVMPSWSQP